MINQYRGLAIAILITSCIIIVGMGHGAVPVIFAEVAFPIAKTLKFSLTLTNNDEDSIAAGALFLLIGQLLLFISTHKLKLIMRLVALVMMWIGFFYLVHNIFTNGGSAFTFATGSPFLFLSVALFSFDVRQYWLQNKTDIEQE
ncbi:hypothetical protein SNE26_01755 [Mucilaginibacter sp. cycad4]|uniref:hypothetical protein n=1 Tax=Mucilaginibacter sp. cycad4 TaxID=3342096 RepID=UPI002AAB9E83|nr:hypothetical protein [Mucilaginibacter gossypii]WPV00489.1 hypothetical protein SNE26_01755 [Mucilaginibacter gossypii]